MDDIFRGKRKFIRELSGHDDNHQGVDKQGVSLVFGVKGYL